MINTYSDKKLILMFYSTYLYSTNIKISCVNINDEEDTLDFVIKLTPDILYYIDKETYYFLDKEYKIIEHKLLLSSNTKISNRDFNKLGIDYLTNLNSTIHSHNSNDYYTDYQSVLYVSTVTANAKGGYYLYNVNLYNNYIMDSLRTISVFIPNIYSEELKRRNIFPYQLTSKQNCKPIELNNN